MLKASRKGRVVQGCLVLVCALVLVSWGLGFLCVRCWGLVCVGRAAWAVRCLLCAVRNLAEMAWCVCETLLPRVTCLHVNSAGGSRPLTHAGANEDHGRVGVQTYLL